MIEITFLDEKVSFFFHNRFLLFFVVISLYPQIFKFLVTLPKKGYAIHILGCRFSQMLAFYLLWLFYLPVDTSSKKNEANEKTDKWKMD